MFRTSGGLSLSSSWPCNLNSINNVLEALQMSRATPDDQLKFLLNCVKHSNNGKIDFVEVAKECGIVSKGAAAKRYERLMKANGIHPNGGPSEKATTPAAPRDKPKASTAKVAASKKRKIETSATGIKADDEDDRLLTKPKMEPGDLKRVKPEPVSKETKSSLISKSTVATTSTLPLIPVHYSPPPQPQQLFNAPQMSYPQQRHYHPHLAHMAHYPGPLLQLPSPRLPPPPFSQCQYPMRRPSLVPRHVPPPDDRLMFEDFCTPELFEQRTFLELPQVELIPPPPQEVTMKDLSIEERPIGERTIEKKPVELRSGRRPSESILIVD